MGNKMGYVSRPRDAQDLSIADATDCPVLDDQTVQDLLETGTFHLPDSSTGDSRDDEDKVDSSRTDVLDHDTLTNETDFANNDAGDHGATSTIEVLKARVMLEEIIESSTARHRYQPRAARVSLVRRLLNWLMNRFGAV